MKLLVGTSGYGYKEWKGSFYPEKLPQKEMLNYYGQHFSAVELNNTFRRMPTAASLKPLLEEVPSNFRIVVKAPQTITHIKRLNGVDTPLTEFKSALKVLGKQRGPVLFQLPPNFKKDLDRLTAFLKKLGKSIAAAFEFRHASWYDDEVFELLRKHSCALCAADSDETPPAQFLNSTTWGYVRLRREGYSKKELKAWLKKIKDMGWGEVYVFFKHEETGTGPRLAKELLKIFNQL